MRRVLIEHMFFFWPMTSRRKPGLDPVTATRVKLDAVSGRLAHQGAAPYDAAAELRAIAGDRAELLTGVAAGFLGRYLARPGSCRPDLLPAVAYLVLAGVDPDQVVEQVDDARARQATPTHGSSNN